MTIQPLANWVISFILLVGFVSCHGQAQKDSVKEEKKEALGNIMPKLKKTQGPQESENIHCGLQDKAGNLWFGTTGEGVYKFDGKSFTQYTTSDGLLHNKVFCIFEDHQGKIWIGTNNGISVYDDHSFKEVPIVAPIHSIHNILYIFSIMQAKDGKIWIATVEGVYVYDGASFTRFTVSEGERGFISNIDNVENILEDAAGNLWFGGRVNQGVFRYDGQSIAHYKIETLEGHDWAWPNFQDSQGNIWFSNWGGVYKYDGKSFKVYTKKDGLLTGATTRIMEDKNGILWFAGSEGIDRYDGKSFTHFTVGDEQIKSVWTLLEDREGNIWIGTRNMKLYRFDGETITNFSDH